jgi:hypothetical protein
MTQRQRAVFFLLALATLLVIGRAATGSFAFFIGDFWFTSGLLLLILLSIVDQPHFSKDANVFVNGATGLVALLAVPAPQRDWIWWLFFWWSWSLIAVSYALILRRSAPLRDEPAWIRTGSRIVRTIGRPQALFSAFFLWGVLTQFTPDALAYRALLLFWSVFMILNLPGVATGLVEVIAARPATARSVARIRGQVAPRLIELEVSSEAPRDLIGKQVNFLKGEDVLYSGTVVDDRTVAGLRTASAVLLAGVDSLNASYAAPDIRFIEAVAPTHPVGVVCSGTTTTELHVDVNAAQSLSEGRLLAVPLQSNELAYYQIVAARVSDESLGRANGYHLIEVRAAQLGTWHASSARFEPVQWVPPPGEAVCSVDPQQQLAPVPTQRYSIGKVPHSPFPAHVDLQDIVTHNTAILGVTGSGKSFLSLHLTRGLAAAGVKVLILDASRQHFLHLAAEAPEPLRSVADVQAWLESDKPIGVFQFASATNFPSATADFTEKVFHHLQATVVLRPGHNESARVVIVLEEAHSLVPEWNQVAEKDDSKHVNRTARVLLQGRKYGLGCILISQRTANVTKTMLNQCNTIFALQCFDQTGLDFLHNYMGAEYAQALSSLASRHAVLVGKASSSPRPLIVQLDSFE